MIVYVFLAMVLLDGGPEVKGAVKPTMAECEQARAELLVEHKARVLSRSICTPVPLETVQAPRQPTESQPR